MREIITIPVEETVPSIAAVLEGQGIPRRVQPDPRTLRLAQDALSLFREKAEPRGILVEIEKGDFRDVFEGEGLNEEESPVRRIAQASENLALFAATLGESVCAEISRLFRENDFALGSMLDSAASEGAEMSAQALEDHYRKHLEGADRFDRRHGTLRFSPGYCGWHLTGQKKLFALARPVEIGITLNDSCLMQPIKSISGVVIAGRKYIFEFDDTFAFCQSCTTHTCRDRISALLSD